MINDITCYTLFLPLIGFLVILAFYKTISKTLTSIIACSTVLLAFLSYSYLLYQYSIGTFNTSTCILFNWIPVEGINASFGLHIDHLSLLMTLIITGVGFLIHVYSIGYMDHEEDYARFFACMNLFIFSMLLLVLASNLLLLFVGWEGVGLASYLLIGYYFTRTSAAQAATKAFVVNRIGDFGLLIGLLLTFYLFGTSEIVEINERVGKEFAVGAPVIMLLSFLYFWGATGKSAQIPLYTWLPDAMEGPTPVSALIHAATMVTAGVYLVVRMHPVFLQAPWTMHLVGYIGGATALVAALSALAQKDLKRVLAYSTVSQLGYMFLACGVGAFYAAMFHLTTHAFVKALLFLSAGNVVHMMRGTTDMAKMGGLKKIFNKTHILFFIGVLALSGIPPLAIFFSKDLILELEHEAGYQILFAVGLVTAVLTAFYLTRAYVLTFLGTPNLEPKILKTVREAPPIMVIPVSILAMLAIFGGLLGFSTQKIPFLENFLIEDDPTLVTHPIVGFELSPVTWLSILGALVGVGTAWIVYTRYKDRLGHNITLLYKSFYLDEIYEAVLVNPLKKLAEFIGFVTEPKLFEGSILFAASATQETAGILQKVQSGQIRSYLSWIILGAVLLILYALR